MFPKTKENKLFYKFKNKKYFVRYTIGIIKISFKYLETIIFKIKIFVWIFLRDKYSFNLKIEDKSTDFSSYVYLYDENIKVFKK